MKTIFLFSIAVFCNFYFAQAEPVTIDEAQKVALAWYQHIAGEGLTDYSVEFQSTETNENIATFYIFIFKSGGFVIVAADDASIPILGYSEKNPFPEELSYPSVREWLDDYSRHIIGIIKSGLSNSKTKKDWDDILNGIFPPPAKDVDPLLTTTWNQGCYYNELCPSDPAGPCAHAVTGCVATAMAQVMKYHNYPHQGVSTHSYPHPVYGTLTVDYGSTLYDWASMPNSLTSSNPAVATIMYHAGVSVDMNYAYNQSGTFENHVPNALVEYFNYHPGIQTIYMLDFPDPEEWKNLLRGNLDELLPIVYFGTGATGGHAFVCDGYQMSDGKFHFNWGWGGYCDGWFEIGTLNPGTNTFNLGNSAILQIKPYNDAISCRITTPRNNAITQAGNLVTIEATSVYETPDEMKITVDDYTVATGNTTSLSHAWYTTANDAGSHDVRVWAFAGNDSVYHRINLNVSDEWEEESSNFQTPLRGVHWMHAVDTNIVWAVVRAGINEWGTPVQEFTRTTDGGETWMAGTLSGCAGMGCAMVFAMSGDKAYVPMFRYSGTNPMGVYVTTDGGATWIRQETALFNASYSFPDCIHFFNENDGWCMGDPIPQSGGLEFEIYTTTDGGTNWIAVPAADKPNPLTAEFGIFDYSAVNDTIWYGTSKGRVYKSTDKGYHWTVSSLPGMGNDYITPVFRNGSHGLAHNFFNFWDIITYDDAAIFETFDGGETWAPLVTAGPAHSTDLAFIAGSANTWVSTGGRRELPGRGASFSLDGGHTWSSFPGTEGAMFRYMSWISPQRGWAGSYNMDSITGGIYKFTGDLSSTHCLPEGITFTTQEQIDNFQVDYPGCTEIEGSVTILHPYLITNLSGLSVLTSIGGSLQIGDVPGGNNNLFSLDGLDNLASIGGGLIIYNNSHLLSLNGLNSLLYIGGELQIGENFNLSSLSALGSLTSAGGSVHINDTKSADLTGLENLTSIGGDLWICFNQQMKSFSGLGEITAIPGSLKIFFNDSLASFETFGNLNSIWGDLSLLSNHALTGLNGLENLTYIDESLRLNGNASLTSLASLENLTHATGISIGGSAWINGNPLLTGLEGLGNIEAGTINSLFISHNISLSECDVQSLCNYLAAPGGTVTIENNAPGCNSPEEVLEACEALGVVELDKPGGQYLLSIYPNPFTRQTTIEFDLQQTGPVHLAIYNLVGEKIAVLVDENRPSGTNNVIWNAERLPAGIYHCLLRTTNRIETAKLIKLRF